MARTHSAEQLIPATRPAAPTRPFDVLIRVKAFALLILGPVAGALCYFGARTLGQSIAKQQDLDLEAIGVPASLILAQPWLAVLPGLIAGGLALLAILTKRGRLLFLALATLSLFIAVSLMLVTLLQTLGPMYEYREM